METVKTEHRESTRQPLLSRAQATLVVGGHPYPATIHDYALRGFGLKVQSGALRRAGRETPQIELLIGETSFSGEIRHSRPDDHSYQAIVGIRTVNSAASGEVTFRNEDSGWDLIEDPETLKNLFEDLCFKGPEVLIEVRQPSGQGLAFARSLNEKDVLELEIQDMKRGALNTTVASFRFEIFQTSHTFEAKIDSIKDKAFTVALPKRAARLLRRETFRVRNETNGVRLTVDFSSRLLGVPQEPISVWDFSEHGLSVLDPKGWANAPEGVPFEDIVITTQDGTEIHGRGAVRCHRWDPDAGAYLMGVVFEASTPQDRTAWHNTILAARYPTLSFDYRSEDHKEIWELFDRSGYLGLGDREAFSHVFDLTKVTWEKLRRAGTKTSKRAMIRIDGRIVGHLQMDRIFPRAWCVHHLAIDPKVSRLVGKDLYSVTTDVLSAEGAECVFTVTEAAKPWNQRNYYDFVSQYRFPEHNDLKTFQLYEVDLEGDIRLERHPGLTLRAANQYDLRRIGRYFEIYGNELERRALALELDTIDLNTFDKELAPFGLSRKREFVVALLNGQFVGFARIETGTPGVNLWNFTDMLSIHLMPELGAAATAVHETLVLAGLNRYREIGRKNVVVLLEDGRPEYYTARGVQYVFDVVRWIGSCVATRRYHAFSSMLFGHLILRREQIRTSKRNS